MRWLMAVLVLAGLVWLAAGALRRREDEGGSRGWQARGDRARVTDRLRTTA